MATESTGHEHHHGGYGIDARAGLRALEPLSELPEYRIADSRPDIRGWHLATTDGRAGCVRDLLVDIAAMSVRFLDVELDASCDAPAAADAADAPPRPTAKGRHVLVPLSLADLDEDMHEVRLPRVRNSELGCLPDYRGEPLTPERERAVAACFGMKGQGGTPPAS